MPSMVGGNTHAGRSPGERQRPDDRPVAQPDASTRDDREQSADVVACEAAGGAGVSFGRSSASQGLAVIEPIRIGRR